MEIKENQIYEKIKGMGNIEFKKLKDINKKI